MVTLYRRARRTAQQNVRTLGFWLRIEQAFERAMFMLLSDKAATKLRYKLHTGRALNLVNPTTFSEKLAWLKLNNRDPLLVTCSDKVEVRNYVKQLGLDFLLVDSIGVVKRASDIEFEKLPTRAFIKTNHGSGVNVLWDSSKDFDFEKFLLRFNAAMRHSVYYRTREWNYRDIQPRIIIEHVVESDGLFCDFRFFCFDGKVKAVFVDLEATYEDGTHKLELLRNVYTRSFELMDLRVSKANFDPDLVPRPHNFDDMIRWAESLSEPFPFCRVDFYHVDGRTYFSELTFYPADGMQEFDPAEYDLEFGSWIDLGSPRIKRLTN